MTINHRTGRRRGLALAIAGLTAAALLGGCGTEDDKEEEGGPSTQAELVSVEDAWVKAVDSGMTGAFGIVVNNGEEDAHLVSASTEAAGMVELHETVEDGNGQPVMRPKEGGFVIPGGESHELAPGGDHIMFMEVTEPLKPGDEVHLKLEFADGSTMSVHATVKEFTGADENYQSGSPNSTDDTGDMGDMEMPSDDES